MNNLAILTLLLIAGIGAAYDQRDGSNGVPYLAPDPSLKTTDAFYLPDEQKSERSNSVILPPIFGGPMSRDWMNLSEHNEKLNSSTKYITATDSYALTEDQMRQANIALGEENYL